MREVPVLAQLASEGRGGTEGLDMASTSTRAQVGYVAGLTVTRTEGDAKDPVVINPRAERTPPSGMLAI